MRSRTTPISSEFRGGGGVEHPKTPLGTPLHVARDSSVGIATAYGLDGPGIESWWGTRLSAPIQTGPEAHPASCKMGTVSFLAVSCGRGVKLTPSSLSSAEVKNRVELYLYSP